jgi:hypothetical protein
MKTIFKVLSLLLFFTSQISYSQIGIGTTTPDESAIVEIQSDNKGMLIPRVSTANLPSSPAKGLIVFNTTEDCMQQNVGTSASPKWECMVTNSESTVKSFYPPAYSLEITSTGAGSFNIYNHYSTTYANAGAAGISVYPSNELDFVVLNYDQTVFSSVTIDNAGVLNYTVSNIPSNNSSLINVLFVVK